MPTRCSHIDQTREVTPRANGCEECLRTGQHWVSLRTCQTCGHVGCCDSSEGKHARHHFEQVKHPIIKPYPGMEWAWCYIDEDYIVMEPLRPPEVA